jgi:hypothetical protein
MKNMNSIEKIGYLFVFVLLMIGALLSHLSPEFFEKAYVVEDGLIEWLQVAALTIGMGLCMWRLFALRSQRPLPFLMVTLVLGLLFLFGAGEELSWGQRILGLQTPEWFQTHNVQEELNLHNLKVGRTKINRLVFSSGLGMVVFLYLFVLTPLHRLKPRLARLIDSFGIPVPQTHQVIAYAIALLMVQVLVSSSKRGELREFAMLFLFVITIAFPFNRRIFDRGTPLPEQTQRGE